MTPIRSSLAAARTLVVKVGTAVLTGGGDRLDRAYMHDLSAVLAGLMSDGRRIVLVSSGAVAAGVGELALPGRPSDMAGLQAAAAAGQPVLMAMWREAFGVRRRAVAQLLLTRGDFDSRERFLNIRNCAACLVERGVVPVINENDSVATEEISLGDNDLLAAKLAVAIGAEALVILTSVGGVLDGANAIVAEAAGADELARHIRTEKSAQGRGGMASKLSAARAAGLRGVVTVIAPGRPPESLGRVCAGEPVGTAVGTGEMRVDWRRSWMALSATPSGAIDVDDGAARALRERGASLLAKGITGVAGGFEVGDVVSIRDRQAREIGRGLTNFSSAELAEIRGRDSNEFETLLGRRVHDEVVHRDNLAVIG
ncbi:MAG: glutamate 5-kinase [Phycisphaerales bacterium]|nr:glutamate 5-kinase [Phycisphaerales bacterium]